MNDHLLRIKSIVDNLLSVGYSMSTSDHIDTIFEGLPSEYVWTRIFHVCPHSMGETRFYMVKN